MRDVHGPASIGERLGEFTRHDDRAVLAAGAADADVQVTVLDPSGKAALQQNRVMSKGDNQMNFDISRLSNGIYFVEVRNGKSMSTRKLVVQH